MPFPSHITTVSIFPHVLSRVDPISKNNYREKYQKIKKYGSAAVLTGVEITEGTQLAKYVISSKLKAYSYKSLFAVVSGPVVPFVSLPFYIFSYGSQFRRFALLVTKIGAKITKREMGIVNWAWKLPTAINLLQCSRPFMKFETRVRLWGYWLGFTFTNKAAKSLKLDVHNKIQPLARYLIMAIKSQTYEVTTAI